MSGPPVSAPPNRAGGRVFVSGAGVPVGPGAPAEPATRYDEYGGPIRQQPPVQQQRVQQRPTHQDRRSAERQPAERRRPVSEVRRRGPFARAMLTLLVLVLLIATPVVAGYVSYYLTADRWPPPADAWFDSNGP